MAPVAAEARDDHMHPVLLDAMKERAASGRPIRVALVGAGRFGTTVAAQIGQIPALRLSVVCDLRAESARGAWEAFGGKDVGERLLFLKEGSTDDLGSAIEDGRPVVTTDVAAAVGAP